MGMSNQHRPWVTVGEEEANERQAPEEQQIVYRGSHFHMKICIFRTFLHIQVRNVIAYTVMLTAHIQEFCQVYQALFRVPRVGLGTRLICTHPLKNMCIGYRKLSVCANCKNPAFFPPHPGNEASISGPLLLARISKNDE